MVRLSLVNMYLHGFTTPKIFEYDTLSSEDRWNETFDVILANPPFMTPKGGIRPHKKFGVQANKAEVLFTDYIAEHLNKNGRAGIVVPNGIVATTQTAYKQLRKMLVDDSLIAVISLPAGCFMPYSGVKTSILMLDKSLAKKTNQVLFIKVNNDGFDLGAQRREIDKNDLPLALEAFNSYKESIALGKHFDKEKYNSICALVEKEKIVANKDIVLNSDRYSIGKASQTEFDVVKLGDIAKLVGGSTPSKSQNKYWDGGNINWITCSDFKDNLLYIDDSISKITQLAIQESSVNLVPAETLIMVTRVSLGKFAFVKNETALNQDLTGILLDKNKANKYFIYYVLNSLSQKIINDGHGATVKGVTREYVKDLEIPLPPLETQEQIVKEIQGYQKIIDGAKMVVDNYKPIISIKPEWEMVELGEVCKPEYGYTETAKEKGNARYIRITDIGIDGKLKPTDMKYVETNKDTLKSIVKKDDILVARTGATYGKTMIFDEEYQAVFASFLIRLNFNKEKIFPKFYWVFAQSQDYISQAERLMTGGGQPQFNGNAIIKILVPVPSIEEQKSIVEEIENEMTLVEHSKKLISLFEQKIKDKINEVWGLRRRFK